LEDVKSHAGGKGYVFPMLKDDNNSVADMLGATRTPEVYVIDKNGIILYHGSIDDNRDAAKVSTNHLRNALDEIIAGKEVSVKNTKFFGCTIKRAEK
jgi:alkyl hydroperoxide reductase subunit AhpC